MPTHEERRWIGLYKGQCRKLIPLTPEANFSCEWRDQAMPSKARSCNENHRLRRDLANASRNLRLLALSAS